MSAPRKFDRTSATQITLFRRCPRKWYTEYILGRRSPSTVSQEKGIQIHSEVEGYLLGGGLPGYESARRLMLDERAPKPGVKLRPKGLVEWPADYNLGLTIETKHGPVAVRGRIDYVEDEMADGFTNAYRETVGIWDWKSSSNFTYCKTPEELELDVQCIIYSAAVLLKYKAARSTVFHHGYASTCGSDHRIVSTRVLPFNFINDRYIELMETVRLMADMALRPLEEVSKNLNACGDYGGCHLREECGVIRNQTFQELFKTSPQAEKVFMGLKDKIAAAKQQQVSTQPIAPSVQINPPDAAKPATVVPFVRTQEVKVDYEKAVVNLLQEILAELRNGPQRAA